MNHSPPDHQKRTKAEVYKIQTKQNTTYEIIDAQTKNPACILYISTAGRYRPVSYTDGPITARYRFIKNAYWVKNCNRDTALENYGELEPVLLARNITVILRSF